MEPSKKLFLASVLLIIVGIIVWQMTLHTFAKKNAEEEINLQSSPIYFTFDAPKKITFEDADAKKIAKNLTLFDRNGNKHYAVTNIIDSSSIAISPILPTEEELTIRAAGSYSVSDYDGLVYVQNQENLNHIYTYGELASAQNTEHHHEPYASPVMGKDMQGIHAINMVATDRKNIYYARFGRLLTISADTKDMKRLSEVEFSGTASESDLFLKNGKLYLFFDSDYTYGEYGARNISYAARMYIYDIHEPEPKRKKELRFGSDRYIKAYENAGSLYVMTEKYISPYEIQENQPPKNIEHLIYLPFSPSLTMTKISKLDFESDDICESELFYMGCPKSVYISENDIYIASVASGAHLPKSLIYKFTDLADHFNFVTSAAIEGSSVQASAFYKKEDQLYVLHELTRVTDDRTVRKNYLTIFDEDMEKISEPTNIANDCTILSAKYTSDKVYMNTSAYAKPILAADIEDPLHIPPLTRLKMPTRNDGTSHFFAYDQNFFIDISKESDHIDDRSVCRQKISLFDISDVENPALIDTKFIGEQDKYNDFIDDRSLFAFDYERNLFIYPVLITTYNKSEDAYKKSDVYVFELTEQSLNLRGKITGYDDSIKKPLQIDDVLYTISPYSIKATDIHTLKELAHCKL